MKTFTIVLIIQSAMVISCMAVTSSPALYASSKGLKLYLTVDTNLNDDFRINTHQYVDRVFMHDTVLHSGSNADLPDVAGCEDFLQNATNKEYVAPFESESDYNHCVSLINFTCLQESNPENYCLKYDDPAFCKTIGDHCDEDGFVKPEYPYCKGVTD